MRKALALSLRMFIALAVGLLIGFLSNPLARWPFGLPLLLALVLGMLGMIKASRRSSGFFWFSTSCLIWLGLEIPVLIQPQEIQDTFYGCLQECDGGVTHNPSTFALVFIGFLLGLFAIACITSLTVGTVYVIRDWRNGTL